MFKNSERKIEEALNREAGIVSIANPKTGKKEEWIWVEGYKGTDEDMQCRGYQYEIGKQYDMPDDAEIEECEKGFHLCMTLKDVFGYYDIKDGNRFFKVRALVRKEKLDNYGELIDKRVDASPYATYFYGIDPSRICIDNSGPHFMTRECVDKLAARSIEFIRELTIDEILEGTDAASLPDKYKKIAIAKGVMKATKAFENHNNVMTLMELGYCEAFAKYIVEDMRKYEHAYALGKQTDLSMDMKVFALIKGRG